MKKSIIITLFMFFGIVSFGQKAEIKTIEFPVSGNCDMCKTRIENAADIKGVKLAVWNVEAKTIKVTYNEGKTTLTKVKEAIAKAGYDADGVIGDNKAYDALPGCCQYRTRTHSGN